MTRSDAYIKARSYEELVKSIPFAVKDGELKLCGDDWDIVVIPPMKVVDDKPLVDVEVSIEKAFANVKLAIASGVKDEQLWTAIVRCSSDKSKELDNNVKFTSPPDPAVQWL